MIRRGLSTYSNERTYMRQLPESRSVRCSLERHEPFLDLLNRRRGWEGVGEGGRGARMCVPPFLAAMPQSTGVSLIVQGCLSLSDIKATRRGPLWRRSKFQS